MFDVAPFLNRLFVGSLLPVENAENKVRRCAVRLQIRVREEFSFKDVTIMCVPGRPLGADPQKPGNSG